MCCTYKHFKESKLQKQLPIPRIEMRITQMPLSKWDFIHFEYGIVLKTSDQLEGDTCSFLPINQGAMRGYNHEEKFEDWLDDNGQFILVGLNTEFQALAEILKLKHYVVCEEAGYIDENYKVVDITPELTAQFQRF